MTGTKARLALVCLIFAIPGLAFASETTAIAAFQKYVARLESSEGRILEEHERPFIRLAEKPSGKTVVLVHGMLDYPDSFKDLATAYQSRGYNVVSILLDGFSHSFAGLGQKGVTDWRRTVDEGLGIARQFGDDVHLGGYSFGGLLSVDAVQRNPAAVKKLILFGPALKLETKMQRMWDDPQLFLRVFRQRFQGLRGPEFEARFAEIAVAVPQQRKAIERTIDIVRDLKIPVTVVIADPDKVVDNGAIEAFARAQSHPASSLVRIEGVDHTEIPLKQARKAGNRELPSFAVLLEKLGLASSSGCVAGKLDAMVQAN